MKLDEVDINKVSPMMKHYIQTKRENKDIILFYRLGDFYEMFFEDAIVVSHELELTLTGKSAGLDERIPMCGIPYHAANIYIEKLVSKGYKIGICEQLEDPKTTKGIVKRGIVQIISSGTVISDESLKSCENNYICAILDLDNSYSISYGDISTGCIYTSLIEHSSTTLVSEIVSLHVKEVVLKNSFDKNIYDILKNTFNITVSLQNEISTLQQYEYIYSDIKDYRLIEVIKLLLTYINNTQFKDLSHLQKAIVKVNKDYLKMDIYTKRNLELTETTRLKTREHSLIWLLDKTKTAMGSRMLKETIENPLVNSIEINKRYDIVDTLLKEFILTDDLRKYLNEVYDLERLSGKIAFSNVNARDMLQLKNSLKVLPKIKEILDKINFYKNVYTMDELCNLLEESIYENPPITIKEGYLIKEGYSRELDELKDLRKGGKEFIAQFEASEKEKTGIKNLKVGYNRIFGYYIEVSKSNINLIKDEYGYERRQTLANCERYISPVLKEKEALILNAEEKIIDLEYNIFIKIKDEVKKYIPQLQEIAKVISEIDILQSFAKISEENNYIRPTISLKQEIFIENNRHPVIEKVLKDCEYVPNDIKMDEETNILLITGPNMAGKSTYMRQLAITVIMAQIGCFIPASRATIPIFDAIYTRIGASDDLVSGESTFMVEMRDANNAITNATSKSLILFDELGRGTATYDGMALAQSIIEYIHDKIGCKTLFSTHYHELTGLTSTNKNLKNVHVSAYEENGNLTFLHKIIDGSVDKSYGIHVAKLAKLPNELITRAQDILKVYENKENKKSIYVQQSLPLESNKESEIEKIIKDINPLEITPLEALNILYNLKNKMK